MLSKIGLNVEYVATDWGTVGARRASKEPVDKGGWNIFHTWHAGVDCVNPGAAARVLHHRRQGLVRLAEIRSGAGARSTPGSPRRILGAEKAAVRRSTRRRWIS